ncbi:hypothetical protein [Nocardia jejuensis]|uniref:hypothetical protein n=1 Tax=Nocardia jejuensis TaxID=328049 RepID=UPI000A066D1A|nr:hypothetical protein [Nocardia jejuensis]
MGRSRGGRRTRGGSRTEFGGILVLVVLIWIIVGAVAAGQRHYFDSGPMNCASSGTVAATVFAGPLNYTGMNPRIESCAAGVAR